MFYGDHTAAREPLAAVCTGGDGFACYRLAELHQKGQGGPVDVAKATQLYEESCTYKYGEGCERRYQLATEVPTSPELELDFALKACDFQRPLACMHAAGMIRAGRGAEPDLARVTKVYEKACALKDLDGCNGVGDLLADPEGPAEDKARSLTAFIKACVGHSGYGCLRVGVAFHEGIGTPPDLARAQAHFTRACEFSEKDGCRAAEQLAAANGSPITLELTTRAEQLAADGLEARSLSCRMSEQGLPALGEVLSVVARTKGPLDACAKDGEAVRVTWEFARGRVLDAKVTDPVSKKLQSCVASALRKAKLPGLGACEAVLLLGDPSGAAKALASRADAEKARGDGRRHIRVSADAEGE